MAIHRSRSRRSTTEWSVRGLIAAVAAIVGYVSIAATIGYADRSVMPERAHALAPWDGRVTAALAWKLSGADGDRVDRGRSALLARRALRQDATAVAAATALGLNADSTKNDKTAARIFNYAESLSRRDLPTQLWKIEAAVVASDVSGALRHYDIALRTSRQAFDLLFPVLVSASTNPAIRSALATTLTGKPSWGPSFVEYAATNSTDTHATSLLFRQLQQRGYTVAPVARTLLIDTLAARGSLEDAWAYYRSVHRNADRRQSRDPRFTADPATSTVFDWRIVSDSGISASIQRGGSGGLVDFAVPAGIGGAVVQQMQMLTKGSYRITGHTVGIEQPNDSRPYWVITCRNAQELGRIELPDSTHNDGLFVGTFDVPAQCPAQTLTLMLRPSDTMASASGQIDRVQVVPVTAVYPAD